MSETKQKIEFEIGRNRIAERLMEKMKVDITIEKDGEGYLAGVKGHEHLFAFAYSKKEALIELKNVVEMVMDYHLEQVNDERIIKNKLTSAVEHHAVQI